MSNTTIPLGKQTAYPATYDAGQLYPVARASKRAELGLKTELPFIGEDLWNGYEISWLNPKGKPLAALGQFRFPCTSASIVESKSFKLYLNSFNQSRFESCAQVAELMEQDLSSATGASVGVELYPLSNLDETPLNWQITPWRGTALTLWISRLTAIRPTQPCWMQTHPPIQALRSSTKPSTAICLKVTASSHLSRIGPVSGSSIGDTRSITPRFCAISSRFASTTNSTNNAWNGFLPTCGITAISSA